MKPRLRYKGPFFHWGCSGDGWLAYGATPEAAYRLWRSRNVERNR